MRGRGKGVQRVRSGGGMPRSVAGRWGLPASGERLGRRPVIERKLMHAPCQTRRPRRESSFSQHSVRAGRADSFGGVGGCVKSTDRTELPSQATSRCMKSTVDEIRRRFDADVERFSNLETGQSATVDAPLAMSLVADAAAAVTPHAQHVIDIGCGAGNYTLRLLERLPNLDVTLVDLSRPMLDRSAERVGAATRGRVAAVQADVREVTLPTGEADVILAAAVLHHLRDDNEWEAVFASFRRWLRPGGSVWVFDLVDSPLPALGAMFRRRYGDYLVGLRDEAYRDAVFAYVEQEDTPRPLLWQLDRMRAAGFTSLEVLHKHVCFAAFGGVAS